MKKAMGHMLFLPSGEVKCRTVFVQVCATSMKIASLARLQCELEDYSIHLILIEGIVSVPPYSHSCYEFGRPNT